MRNLLIILISIFPIHCFSQPYLQSALFYNSDAHGITSNEVAHIALGYEINWGNGLTIDFQARHESDPKNSGNDDLIANESFGVIVKYKLGD